MALMEARAPRIAMGVLLVLVAGCSAILGLEDNLQYSPGPPADGGGGDVALDAPLGVTCADGGGICLSKNRAYSGPLLVYTGPERPACPGQTPPSFTGETLIEVPDADCGCACASD